MSQCTTPKPKPKSVYISFCTAQTGFNPTQNSLIAFGAAAFTAEGVQKGRIEVGILPYRERPDDPEYMRVHWQDRKTQWDHIHQNCMTMQNAAVYISNWLKTMVGHNETVQWLSDPADNGFFKSNYMEVFQPNMFPVTYEFIDITTFVYTYAWSHRIDNVTAFTDALVGLPHGTPYLDAVRQGVLFHKVTYL